MGREREGREREEREREGREREGGEGEGGRGGRGRRHIIELKGDTGAKGHIDSRQNFPDTYVDTCMCTNKHTQGQYTNSGTSV